MTGGFRMGVAALEYAPGQSMLFTAAAEASTEFTSRRVAASIQ